MYQSEKQKAILTYLRDNAYKTCRMPTGRIKYPYVEPGANYINSLWDWDALFCVEALIDVTERLKNTVGFNYEEKRKLVIDCGKGCVLNFLDEQYEDGYIPIGIFAGEKDKGFFGKKYAEGVKMNQIKPVLAQFILQVSEYCGDFSWFDLWKVEKYFDYYKREQLDTRTGLYVWQNDLMIGIDNNPATFFRPAKSSADIYLNTFMYADLTAFVAVLERLNEGDKAEIYRAEAQRLKNVIEAETYDTRDAFYYSQCVIIDTAVAEMGFHHGFPIEYKGLPIKIRQWVGLIPLWANIPDKARVQAIVEKNFCDDTLFCKAGIRSLASNEKMFSERATNNPSNHIGPVWTINNILVWKGLKNYGFSDLAEELRRRTIDLLGDSVMKDGGFYESYKGNGEHLLFCGFLSWNCLVSEMLDIDVL